MTNLDTKGRAKHVVQPLDHELGRPISTGHLTSFVFKEDQSLNPALESCYALNKLAIAPSGFVLVLGTIAS